MNMKRFKFEERISCLATRKVMFHSNNMNLDSSIQPYVIIGKDNRKRVSVKLSNSKFPYCGVGVVASTWPTGKIGWATGWMFGPNDIATAGHAIYNKKEGGYPSKIVFYPAQNGPILAPQIGYKAINVFVPSKYRKGGKGSSAYDYGVFEVKSNIGKRYGYFGWNSSISMGAALETVGYPFDKTKYEMWKCYGKVMQVHKRYFSHSADAVKSQSGSPLFSPKNKIVRGIHRGGSGVDNYAIKITADFSNLLYKRRNN